MVVPFTSTYDVLIGKDGQAQFHMATSTPHDAMGIPTETGVAIIYKNKECAPVEGPRPIMAIKQTAHTEPEKWVLN